MTRLLILRHLNVIIGHTPGALSADLFSANHYVIDQWTSVRWDR